MQDEAKRIKVLHVLGGLNRGGVETWLMHVLRHIDRNSFQLDFLVHTDMKCAYDDEARALGARVIPNPDPRNPFLYAFNFIRNYRKYGPYDVVHSHVHRYSGFVLFLAWICGAPKRIAHSHTDTRDVKMANRLFRRLYIKTMDVLISMFATQGIAASRNAAESLFGTRWETDGRFHILYCGIDLEPFKESGNIEETREKLGLPNDSFVIGHVGRFSEMKNHSFLVDIAEEVFRRIPNSYLLLVGDGPLRKEIEMRVNGKGMEERVIFTGARDDVPRLLRAMDVFVMPSLYEGLPVALIEAQAAGIPCVISDAISEEADIVKNIIHRMSLSEPPSSWKDKIVRFGKGGEISSGKRCMEIILNSPFNIENSVRALCSLYADEDIIAYEKQV